MKLITVNDLLTKEEYPGTSEWEIVDEPAASLLQEGRSLRAIRFNPMTGNIETITFSKGSYLYSKTTSQRIDLAYGKYEIRT